jgi:hypothetical protein
VRRWVDLLERLHFGFRVRPWFTNVSKALRKEPKWFLRDWSGIDEPGARAETFVACHLLKAVEGWTDMGFRSAVSPVHGGRRGGAGDSRQPPGRGWPMRCILGARPYGGA